MTGLMSNPTYWIFMLPALLLGLIAQAWVKGAYSKYSRVANSARITGAEAAQRLIRNEGLNIKLEGVAGVLTDHYDPRSNTLRLSQGIATQPSIAALAVTAHELGHAEQDANSYALLRLRSGLVPVVNFTSWLGPILFLVGILLNSYNLAGIGVICFLGAVIFSLVTLPVELNASRRALKMLDDAGLVNDGQERAAARRVLSAAALTYVAALVQSISTLLYYVSLLGGGRRRS